MSFRSRFLFLPCALGLFATQHIAAQSLELFGGVTVANMKPEKDYHNLTMSGWNTAFTLYPTYRLGLAADFAGYYGTAQAAPGVSTDQSEFGVRQYSFLAGPQFRLIHKRLFDTSFKALFGAARGYALDVPGSLSSTHGSFDETKFTALFGTNFDLNISRKVALRFSPGIYVTQFGPSETQTSFRFSFGPVFRFGGSEN